MVQHMARMAIEIEAGMVVVHVISLLGKLGQDDESNNCANVLKEPCSVVE